MGKTTTFIMLRASRSEKERHVISVTPSMTEFHNGVGWELFERRSWLGILTKFRPGCGDHSYCSSTGQCRAMSIEELGRTTLTGPRSTTPVVLIACVP